LPRSLACAVVVATLALGSCSKTEPPPPPKVEAAAPPAPVVDEQQKRLAAEVYVYAYPMVLTDVTREVQAAKSPPNTFLHDRRVPDATTADVVDPNADFFYTQAWLDLAKEPVVLSMPDTRDRYYLIALLDAWTNVAASLGKRTTGTDKIDFAIVGPRWKGTLPPGVSEVHSPTELAWLFGRLQTNDRSDHAAIAKIEEQMRLTPLSAWGKRAAKGKGERETKGTAAAPAASVDTRTSPRDQVAKMSASAFFTRFASLLPGNPPAKEDTAMPDKLKALGVVAGQPFDTTRLEPLAMRSIDEGARTALEAIQRAAQGSGSGDVRNGWAIDRDLGRWGVDYGKRAVSAWRGLGVNAPEDAIFMSAHFDGSGRRLDGAHRYVLHFDAKTPPVDGFWSLSLYDDARRFVANPQNRYNVASTDNLRTNADGSIDLYIQNAAPSKDQEANWLPAPKGSFNLILRTYWPKPEVVDGRWVPPGIKRAP
jgi:hypothetical protein